MRVESNSGIPGRATRTFVEDIGVNVGALGTGRFETLAEQFLKCVVICAVALATREVLSVEPVEHGVGRAGAVPGLQPTPTHVEEVIGPVGSESTLEVVSFLSAKKALSWALVSEPVHDCPHTYSELPKPIVVKLKFAEVFVTTGLAKLEIEIFAV